MTKTILVTGGTGFVGRQVVRVLSRKNISLRLVVRRANQKLIRSTTKDIEFVETDDLFAESVDWWAKQCESVDVVLHLAWFVEPGKYLQSKINVDCLQGSLNLARGAIKAGVRRFVGVGTCFEYEIGDGLLKIDTPLRPTTLYAATKVALFTCLSNWLPLNSIEFAWCRLFYLYGEGEDSRRLLPYLRSKLEKGDYVELTSGKQIRDFLNVAEAGDIIAKLTLNNQTGPINICSGIPITIKEFSERVADECGRRDLLVFGARPDNTFDPPCVVGLKNYEA